MILTILLSLHYGLEFGHITVYFPKSTFSLVILEYGENNMGILAMLS